MNKTKLYILNEQYNNFWIANLLYSCITKQNYSLSYNATNPQKTIN